MLAKNPERRVSVRHPILIRQVRVETEREVFFGYATNISSSGIHVQTVNPRSPGLKVRLRFNLPGDQGTIDCFGEVAWSREYDSRTCRQPGMGVKFVDILERDVFRIEAFLREGRYSPDLDIPRFSLPE